MSPATPEQLAQTRSDVLWLISAGIVKNNGGNTYSLTKEAKDLIEQLVNSGKLRQFKRIPASHLCSRKHILLVACAITILKLSKGFLEDVVLLRYAGIVKLLYEVKT